MSISITKHVYLLVKVNKCDKQYLIKDFLPLSSILTERVKVEAFKGYSSAYNLAEYFRLRGTTSWKSGKQVTGLWKSPHLSVRIMRVAQCATPFLNRPQSESKCRCSGKSREISI